MTDETPKIDREALAEQVIVSAGNVLATAGFTREEIGDFFRQAAEQLQISPVSAPVPDATPGFDNRLAQVANMFSQNPAVHELHELAAKANALLPVQPEGDGLRDAFDMTMKAIPLLAEAQQSLRAVAMEVSLPLVPSHAERERRATSGDITGNDPIVCLEDFEALYSRVFEVMGAVADVLVKQQDREAFTFLLGHLADNGVILNSRLQLAFEEGMRSLG